MKNLIFSVVLLLSTVFMFANTSLANDLNIKEDIEKITFNANSKFVFNTTKETITVDGRWYIGCYAEVSYNGELVDTVYSYASGDTYEEAYNNCYKSAMSKARELMVAP